MKTGKYFITHYSKESGFRYLVLRNPVDERGYYWSDKRINELMDDPDDIQFLFESRQKAVMILHDLDITQKCKIVEFNRSDRKESDQISKASQDILEEYAKRYGVPYAINDMDELRKTRKSSIMFPNGWVASIVEVKSERSIGKGKYSVAMCDYNGYFDWNILNQYGADGGCFYCNTELEIIIACETIRRLQE